MIWIDSNLVMDWADDFSANDGDLVSIDIPDYGWDTWIDDIEFQPSEDVDKAYLQIKQYLSDFPNSVSGPPGNELVRIDLDLIDLAEDAANSFVIDLSLARQAWDALNLQQDWIQGWKIDDTGNWVAIDTTWIEDTQEATRFEVRDPGFPTNVSLTYDPPAGANIPPVAIYTEHFAGSSGLVVNAQFDATGSYDWDGHIVSYAWDFESDGVIDATGPQAYHGFAFTSLRNPPNVVTLYVEDNDGGRGRFFTYVHPRSVAEPKVPGAPGRLIR